MKKYILKLALLTLSMGTLMSCEEDTVTYGGKNFVSFDNVASLRFNFFEHRGTAEIPVNMAFPKSNDVNVTFTITSTVAVEGVDYKVLTPGSITIPAGQTTGFIKIQVIDNDIMNDSKSLDVTLTGVSEGDISLGLTDQGSNYKRFLIINDDCTTDFLEFFGKFDVTNDEGDVIGTATADVNESGDCNILMIKGVLEDQLENETDKAIQFTFVPGPNANGARRGTLTAFQQLYCEACYTDPKGNNQTFLFEGGGRFNADTKELDITGGISTISTLYPSPGIPTSVHLKPAK
jgi:hypothetical protein